MYRRIDEDAIVASHLGRSVGGLKPGAVAVHSKG
jgi:hypothetical protein